MEDPGVTLTLPLAAGETDPTPLSMEADVAALLHEYVRSAVEPGRIGVKGETVSDATGGLEGVPT